MGITRYTYVGVALLLGMASWLAAPGAAQQTSGAAATSSTAAGQSGKNQTAASSPSLEQRPRYRVAPGDVMNIQFPFAPEMNQTVTIQPDGYIDLLNVGNFYVQGKTIPELEKSLKEAYGKTLRDPVINVDLKDFQQPFFIVGGQVTKPGKYDLRESTTVAEAVAIAGGFTTIAKHSDVLLFRGVSADQVEVKRVNVKKMLSSADLREDIYLHPGDMIYVPQSKMSKIGNFLPTRSLSMYFDPLQF
jgi:polysaccharide export outer membrane protein